MRLPAERKVLLAKIIREYKLFECIDCDNWTTVMNKLKIIKTNTTNNVYS